MLLVINPISGTLPKDGLEERVRRRLEPVGMSVETRLTERGGHAGELASEAAARGYYAVIAAGGDGTVNEIASALRGTRTALGILPYGSGNGLARHLYVSIDVDHALDVIAKDRPVACDCGIVNGSPFFCTFGLGFDADVSRQFASMQRRGLLSYVRSVVSKWFSYSPQKYEIEAVDEHGVIHHIDVKAFIVAVCNASQYGNNAFIAPGASLTDGLLDIVIIHAGNPLSLAIAGAELFTGRIERNLLLEMLRVRKVTIKRFPGVAHIDGEPCTLPETLRIECQPGVVGIFADPDKAPFKPFITPIESMRDDSSYLIRENARQIVKKIFGKLNFFY